MFLVDTNVISLAAHRHRDDDVLAVLAVLAVLDWLDRNGSQLYLSVMTIAEIEFGVLKLARQGKGERAAAIQAFLKDTLDFYGNRVLPVDVQAALHVADLRNRSYQQPVELADIIIAATAIRHGLIILTHNIKHFAPLGVKAHDPFDTLPKDEVR